MGHATTWTLMPSREQNKYDTLARVQREDEEGVGQHRRKAERRYVLQHLPALQPWPLPHLPTLKPNQPSSPRHLTTLKPSQPNMPLLPTELLLSRLLPSQLALLPAQLQHDDAEDDDA